MILAHNHLSGEAAPNDKEVRITRKLQKAGALIDIPLMDHIVVGGASYTRLRPSGAGAGAGAGAAASAKAKR